LVNADLQRWLRLSESLTEDVIVVHCYGAGWGIRPAVLLPRKIDMTFEKAARTCHVRNWIYRRADPGRQYAKNHPVPLKKRVPRADQLCNDWEEHDPNDDYDFYVRRWP